MGTGNVLITRELLARFMNLPDDAEIVDVWTVPSAPGEKPHDVMIAVRHRSMNQTAAVTEEKPQAGTRRFVYFAEATGLGRVKIGVANDPQTRLRGLMTGSAVSLSLIGIMPGDESLEREIHEKFSAFRTHGEWFDLSEEIREFIREQGVEVCEFFPGEIIEREYVPLAMSENLCRRDLSSAQRMLINRSMN